MSSPIKNRVGAIFIHVSDMQRAVQFYCGLFGLPINETAHEGNIYDLQMSGSSSAIILDSHQKHIPNLNDKPLLFFDTSNIYASYDYIKNKNIEIVGEIEVHENISFFTFKDNEGNVLMICEDKKKIVE